MMGWARWTARWTARRLGDAIRWAAGRADAPAGSEAFRYGRSTTTFLWVITAITVVETAIVELAVPWLWLRVALAVLCIGSLPLMAGMVADYRIRPHLLSQHTLLLRCGAAIQAEVPLSAIASVGRTTGTAPRRPGVVGSALELGAGSTDVVVTLRAVDTRSAQPGASVAEDRPGSAVKAARAFSTCRQCDGSAPVAWARGNVCHIADPSREEDRTGQPEHQGRSRSKETRHNADSRSGLGHRDGVARGPVGPGDGAWPMSDPPLTANLL